MQNEILNNRSPKLRPPAVLALADGAVFRGVAIGAIGQTGGEVVFNTSMSGYQEILTDPSYRNQILTFTCPHIGNVGTNSEDVESTGVQVAGVVVRDLSEHYSNFRSEQSFEDYLIANGIVGIAGVDVRALVVHLRNHGAQMGVISSAVQNESELIDQARALPSMEGQDLVGAVSTKRPYEWLQGVWRAGEGFAEYTAAELESRPLVCAIDYGIKYNILRLLVENGFRVQVVPSTMSSADILSMSPDGIFLSNGPGDPAALDYAIATVRGLLGKKPIFGICLGHQILGHAVGAPTYKLKFGHRGANHPVRNLRTGKVEITVQNHGFSTRHDVLPKDLTVTHVNLNDNTIEGLAVPEARAFAVQYHPEASPGPRDARYLFSEFRTAILESSGV